MDDLKKSFEKEGKGRKIILVAALAGFISSFLPWWSISFGGLGGFSVNGWHSYGFLTALASIAMILLWVLPKVGVKFTLPVKDDVLYKVLSLVMAAGPVLVILDSGFEFSFMGMGVYLALVAGGFAVYFSFITKNTAKVEVKKEEAPKAEEKPAEKKEEEKEA
jgi:hypothetical protein